MLSVCCVGLQVQALLGLSVLELCMLVAAQRLEDVGQPVFNFEVTYAASAASSLQLYSLFQVVLFLRLQHVTLPAMTLQC